MTITSAGYNGTVDEIAWATMAGLTGTDYCVATPGAFKVAIGGTGTLPVTVAAGVAFGAGVLDTMSSAANLNAAALGSGVRWDTVVIRRLWTAGGGPLSALAINTGTSVQQVSRGFSTKGVEDDQPLALIKVQSGLTAVQQVIDLRDVAGVRVWGSASLNYPTWTPFPVATVSGESLVAVTAPARYTRTEGLVHLAGSLHFASGNPLVTTTASTPRVLGTMPVGFRPANQCRYAVPGATETQIMRLSVETDGTVQILNDGVQIAHCYLDSVSYYAEG